MAAFKTTLQARAMACRAIVAACLALVWAVPQVVLAESIPIYSLEISNSSAGLPGSRSASGGFFSGSVLEQWIDQSRPYVRITNISAKPAAMNLFGARLDLTDSASMVTGCEWVEVLGDPAQTWNWNAAETSAFFQFRDGLLPGESVLMRLSTAPRPGQENAYTQNQSLFPISCASRLAGTTNCTSMTLYAQSVESTSPVSFLASGMPSAPDMVSFKSVLGTMASGPCSTIDLATQMSITGVTEIAPVPEPSSIALAASAVAMLACVARGRLRRLCVAARA